jgi:hypothetical protein
MGFARRAACSDLALIRHTGLRILRSVENSRLGPGSFSLRSDFT